ncbi:hypothetical protein IB655_08870 [Francisella noatunensis]|uniref:Uncharacterized protein n=1 Tax=Francisella noatunensis TaxID=657445 RepID=A0A9Q2KXZ3_9GAMM|nr:hypothetical protein [Francisella noatunensis]MBK2029384.1 hypothetical protein [Francisella noatunensis]MBK2034000.1 hypothetical protein [Francisella noatunensis]MBK2049413.1 hypothetical protein [Francisella noatunensis]MBK2052311.1 hypothetical protein [Francisella noatunensis]MBK2053750.1 hypothetical protein [Francisella noatunensis]
MTIISYSQLSVSTRKHKHQCSFSERKPTALAAVVLVCASGHNYQSTISIQISGSVATI